MAGEDTAIQKDKERFSIKGFLSEVKAEMKKVSWPNKRELMTNTGVVTVSVLFVCFLIWLYDTVFNKMLEVILR